MKQEGPVQGSVEDPSEDSIESSDEETKLRLPESEPEGEIVSDLQPQQSLQTSPSSHAHSQPAPNQAAIIGQKRSSPDDSVALDLEDGGEGAEAEVEVDAEGETDTSTEPEAKRQKVESDDNPADTSLDEAAVLALAAHSAQNGDGVGDAYDEE